MDSLTTFLDIKQPLLQHRVSLSPDGKYLAYVVQGAHREKIPKSTPLFLNGCYIALTEVDTGETTVEVMKDDCRSWAPSLSMDSSRLAFYADKDGVTKYLGTEYAADFVGF